jgi:hypothetical protein
VNDYNMIINRRHVHGSAIRTAGKNVNHAKSVQDPPANAMRAINPTPRIPRVSTKLIWVAVLGFELEVLVEDEAAEPEAAGAVGVNVACALERQEVAAAAATADEAGGLGTIVAFPLKSQDAGLRLVIS